MEYISSDTNVWLDFYSIGKVELPFKMHFVYLMFRDALRDEIISPHELPGILVNQGLKAIEITTEELIYADSVAEKYVKLSGYDRIALAIAKIREITLLTGDAALRKAAQKEGVKVFGTIKLLDVLYENRKISSSEYKYCLESWLKSDERRLPAEELEQRIKTLNAHNSVIS